MLPEEQYVQQLNVLRKAGFAPAAIIDIGVGHGTDGLYDVWPEVALCLIEPSHKAQQLLADFAARRPGVHLVHCTASDWEGEADANEDGTRPTWLLAGRKTKVGAHPGRHPALRRHCPRSGTQGSLRLQT